jgi:hypothetical protein
MLDTLMQSALVELFQAYGVALAPMPRATAAGPRTSHLSAAINFAGAREQAGPPASGRLTLALPTGVLELMKHDVAQSVRHGDWTRELVNQLMGRLKNRLLAFGVHLQAGLPSSIGREVLDAQLERASGLRVYRARTLRGDIVATLEGGLNETELTYRAHTAAASEGDLIIF